MTRGETAPSITSMTTRTIPPQTMKRFPLITRGHWKVPKTQGYPPAAMSWVSTSMELRTARLFTPLMQVSAQLEALLSQVHVTRRLPWHMLFFMCFTCPQSIRCQLLWSTQSLMRSSALGLQASWYGSHQACPPRRASASWRSTVWRLVQHEPVCLTSSVSFFWTTMSEWMNDWMDEWMKEGLNEWMDE